YMSLSVPSNNAHRIPVLGNVAAGIPIEMIEDIIDYEEIPANWGNKNDFFCLQIKGDSMKPKMDEGDVLVVRKQSDAETGDTVIFTVNGDMASCKRLRKTDNGLMFIPLNKDYDPMIYSWKEVEELPVRILGKVIELRAKF
ncbi:MAG: LexA family protein, partial [Bacteroides fragilis]